MMMIMMRVLVFAEVAVDTLWVQQLRRCLLHDVDIGGRHCSRLFFFFFYDVDLQGGRRLVAIFVRPRQRLTMDLLTK